MSSRKKKQHFVPAQMYDIYTTFGLAIIICADNLRFNLFYVVSCTITIKNKFSFLPLIFSRILREDVVVLIGDAYVFGRCSLLLPCSSADTLPLHLFGWYNK